MNDAFDDLERELRRAVRARRRPFLKRAPALGLAAALVLGGGGAVAATQIKRDPGVERAGEKLAMQAAGETVRAPGCEHPAKSTRAFTDGPLLPSIARAVPALTRRPAHPAPLPRSVTGAVLRNTSRVIRLPDVRLRTYVIQGPDTTSHVNPAACEAARVKRVRELSAGRSAEVRAAAERAVVLMRDTTPGLQTFWVHVLLGRGEGGFGEGRRLRPGDPLRPGIYTRSGARLVGIAGPGAVAVRVRGHRHPVVEGFYSFEAHGHPTVRELDARGATLRSFRA